jgi:hypothetical protein
MGASFLAIVVIPICGHSKLVVVGDLDILRSFLCPDKAYSKLIVDPDRMLSMGMSRCLLNIEKRSLPSFMLRGVGLASKNGM